jgi:hypothetical protein
MTRRNGLHPDTILEHVGRDPAKNLGIVNPPVYHASTVIFPSLKTLLETRVDRASTRLCPMWTSGRFWSHAARQARIHSACACVRQACAVRATPCRYRRGHRNSRLSMLSSSPVQAPPRCRPRLPRPECPEMYFVAAWITTSTPCASGWKKMGDAQVLSISTVAPCFLATRVIAGTS